MGLSELRRFSPILGLCLILGPLAAAPSSSPAPGARLAEALASAKSLVASPDAAKKIGALADGLPPLDSLALLSEVSGLVQDPQQAKALLLRGGRLALLLGSYSTAAELLEAAAFCLPASRDDALLLSSARCRLAAGESDKAGDRAAIVARSGTSPSLVLGARLIGAWASLLKGDAPEARKLAAALLEGQAKAPGASAERREALFILWVASDPGERPGPAALLAKEYPASPEASLARTPSMASLLPLPHWYLSGVLSGSDDLSGEAAGPSAPAPVAVQPLAPSPEPPAKAQPVPSPAAGEDSGQGKFQVGIFSGTQNASLLVAELGKKGIAARVEKRLVGGRELFAVIVEGEPGATVLKLKDAGYEAWPLF